jgi:methyl-accepting chemotaxis protein
MATAVAEVEYRLNSGMILFKNHLNEKFGVLGYKNGQLLDSNGISIEGSYDVIDRFSEEFDIAVTILVRDASGFRRLLTTLTDESGNRIYGTRLLATNAALKPLLAGQSFMGEHLVLAGVPYIGYYEPVFSSSNELIGALFLGVEISSVDTIIKEGSGRLILTMILVAVFLLAVSLALNFSALRIWIIRPMKKIIASLHRVEEGDIGKQLMLPPGDEMGEIAGHLDKTLENLKHLVMIIQNEAEAVDDIGVDLSANMDRTAIAMNEINAAVRHIQHQITAQSGSIDVTNDAIERITGNVNKLSMEIDVQSTNVSQSSTAIEEMLANIESVTRISRTNSENVSNLTEASEAGRASLEAMAKDIQEIAKESEGLLQINAVLENIASQTNLLSMNAAIQAAHAGEAGKGFAVVASEIRKLAESSANQSSTISTVLKKIRDSMAIISNATGQVLAKFEAIDISVKTVSNQEEQIRSAMEEQSSGSRQILEAVEKLNEITRSVKSGSAEMLKESEEIYNQGKNLRLVTAEITDRMGEMAYRSGEVNSSVNHVNTISRKNRSNIDILREAITQFTITDKYYTWDDSYLIGIAHIDDQHKQLFETVNGLISAIEKGVGGEELKKTLDFLIQYTVTHFNDEEEIQRNCGYPKYGPHHKIHEKFKQTAVELAGDAANIGSSEALIKEVKRKVGDWLVTHVTGEDARIGKFIRAEGRRR